MVAFGVMIKKVKNGGIVKSRKGIGKEEGNRR
jgi:hypothetical protein